MSRQAEKKEESVRPVKSPPIATRRFFGATHLLDRIGGQTHLVQDLDKTFGKEMSQKIRSLTYFLVLENESSMYRFDKFSKTHAHPYEWVISSQRISELFESRVH